MVVKYNPRHLLLIGDNGQWDTDAYSDIQAWVPNTTMVHVYIRQVYQEPYGKNLASAQKAFISAADIAIDLFSQGFLELASVEKVTREVLEDGKNHIERVFSDFSNCSSFNFTNRIKNRKEVIIKNELYEFYRLQCLK